MEFNEVFLGKIDRKVVLKEVVDQDRCVSCFEQNCWYELLAKEHGESLELSE